MDIRLAEPQLICAMTQASFETLQPHTGHVRGFNGSRSPVTGDRKPLDLDVAYVDEEQLNPLYYTEF